LTITNATHWIDSLIAEAKDGLALVRDRLCMVIATIVIGRSLRRNWRFWFRYWNAEQTLALKGISPESANLFPEHLM